jgi:GNAT superfamily N-acetyltransferase
MPTHHIDAIIRTEILFPRTFADVESRDWGLLFTTPTIPDSHDGNHACVLRVRGDPTPVIDEIVAFYRERSLQPRIDYISAAGDSPDLRQALETAGFTFSEGDAMQVYIYRGPSRIEPSPNVRVRRVDVEDPSIFSALTTIGNLRSAKVIARRARREDAWVFVGELDGRVASVALLERIDNISRVDEVATAERHRRKGCARAVIHAVVGYYVRNLSGPLYLWTDNPVAGRIYAEAGFVRTEHSIISWTAYLEGTR